MRELAAVDQAVHSCSADSQLRGRFFDRRELDSFARYAAMKAQILAALMQQMDRYLH